MYSYISQILLPYKTNLTLRNHMEVHYRCVKIPHKMPYFHYQYWNVIVKSWLPDPQNGVNLTMSALYVLLCLLSYCPVLIVACSPAQCHTEKRRTPEALAHTQNGHRHIWHWGFYHSLFHKLQLLSNHDRFFWLLKERYFYNRQIYGIKP